VLIVLLLSVVIVDCAHVWPDAAGAGDNGSGGKLNPAITAGLLITGLFLLCFALAPAPTPKLLFVRWVPCQRDALLSVSVAVRRLTDTCAACAGRPL